jgi:hypothetical protein
LESQPNTYQLKFKQGIASGLSSTDAAIAVVEAYLDGKPARRGKQRIKAAERDAAFWTCPFLKMLPADAYLTEPFVLALARYLGQKQIANFELLQYIAQVAPETVHRAVRYSGLVLHQYSERLAEVERLAAIKTAEFSDFIRICRKFNQAHRERIADAEAHQSLLAALSPLELLTYASLYAFEHLVPGACLHEDQHADATVRADVQEIWYALNDILVWKLQSSTDDAFQLTDDVIGRSLRGHLSPFLFPSSDFPKAREDIYRAFEGLVAAQVELNSFLSRSVDAFCYDDSIRFEFTDDQLAIVEHDPEARRAWQRNGEKLARLHNYWLGRALHELAASGMATTQIGRPENQELNQLAFIKAIRTQLQLTEVYGLDESIWAENGLRVDLFQALLSLELMAAFYHVDFVLPYGKYLGETGHWRQALGLLAMEGLLQGMQNRFPITWSDRAAKIENIRPWTVNNNFPNGHAKAAEAILDFWTNDLKALSNQLRAGGPVQTPELFERPVLKMGRYFFQLPWMAVVQNNASAALNNLRRIGARRPDAREETRRIEQRLAECFEERGFCVCLNYQPARTLDDDPGEVDLICMRDGQLLVLEVKSTFLRRSMRDAWLHKTTTLRKAGLQLRRKVRAVQEALLADEDLAHTLGLENNTVMPAVRGWIVDTSLEHDHERFSGFMKVSVEEVLIALRDDRHWLNDPKVWFSNQRDRLDDALPESQVTSTLYPNGFSGGDFIDVIEQQAVWMG